MVVSDKLVDGTKREFMKNVRHNPFDRNSNDRPQVRRLDCEPN